MKDRDERGVGETEKWEEGTEPGVCDIRIAGVCPE